MFSGAPFIVSKVSFDCITGLGLDCNDLAWPRGGRLGVCVALVGGCVVECLRPGRGAD